MILYLESINSCSLYQISVPFPGTTQNLLLQFLVTKFLPFLLFIHVLYKYYNRVVESYFLTLIQLKFEIFYDI